MTHSIIATLPIKENEMENAITILKNHAEWVKQNEPSTMHYRVHKVKKKNILVVYEQYENKNAFDIHTKNLVERAGNLMTLVDGKLDILTLEDV